MGEGLPRARVSHRLPGRVRLRVPQRRGEADWFADTVLELAMARGVKAAKGDHRLGSLLIVHEAPLEQIAATARRRGLFDLVDLEPAIEPLTLRAGSELAGLEAGMRALTGGTDGRSLLFAFLLVSALIQLARGAVLPPALTLASNALLLAVRDHAATNGGRFG